MDTKKKIKPFKKLPFSFSLEQVFISITVILSIIAAICTFQCVMRFVKVGDVIVNGIHPYGSDEIVDASGISRKDFLYDVDTDTVEDLLMDKLQYISSVEVKRQFPNKIVISVESRTARWYVDIGGTKYTMDGELRIIQEEDSIEEGTAKLTLPNLHSAIYREVPDFGQSDNERIKILTIIDTVRSSTLSDRVSALNLENPTNIRMEIDGKYRVNFGEGKSLAGSLDLVEEALKKEDIKNAQGGTLNVVDGKVQFGQ